MLTPTEVHYIVGFLTLAATADRVGIEFGSMVFDTAAEEERDVDVTVKGKADGKITEVFSGIEVKAHKRPLDVTHVEQLCAKLNHMPSLSRRAIVSASGYYQPAMRKAEKCGVELFELVDWTNRTEGFEHFVAESMPSIQRGCGWVGNVSVKVNPKVHVAESDQVAMLANPPVVRESGTVDTNLPDLETFLKAQQIHAANKAVEHCHPTEPGRGGVNANITIKVEDDYYVLVPSGRIALEELIYSGRIEWDVSINETVYKILRRCGETKPVAGCCLFDWPGKGLTGLTISNANRDLRIVHVPISESTRKKIFRQQLTIRD